MVETHDTIVAIATPPGRGGIGVIRLSGPSAPEIALKIVTNRLQPRYAHFCRFLDKDGAAIDEGIAISFPAPGSYTGEDVVEFHAHGSRAVLDMLVQRAVELGARLARPGEFTERAFHNNRIDLIQAEAVADLINSVSSQAARSAVRSLEGEFSRRINNLLDAIVGLRVQVEGSLDFPEEDAGFHAGSYLSEKLELCQSELDKIFSGAQHGAILNEGANVVITGRPNTGKSTLLNALAGRDIAIVSESPGTTRDLIERDLIIDGIPVHIVDTAGLRLAGNQIEQEGIRRAVDAAGKSDVLLLMHEYGQVCPEEGQLLDDMIPADKRKNKHVIFVYNKIDLTDTRPCIKQSSEGRLEVLLSAKTGEGVDLLVKSIKECLGAKDSQENVLMARKRHLTALEHARSALTKARGLNRNRQGGELLAEELRLVQRSLDEITGAYTTDDLLDEIFRNFCIGK